jgi:hypothetical protein
MKPKPDLSNLRVYGCKTYIRILNIPRLQKLKPRAHIGYLVGYISLNIWRIWVPKKQKVINVRDCIFDESSLYEPSDYLQLINDQSEEPIEPLTIKEFNQVLQDIEIDLDSENIDIDYHIQPQVPQPIQSDVPIEPERDPNEFQDDQILGDMPITPSLTPPIVLIDSQSIEKEDYQSETSEN